MLKNVERQKTEQFPVRNPDGTFYAQVHPFDPSYFAVKDPTGALLVSQERFKGGTLSKTTVGTKNRFKGVFKRKVQSGTLSKTTVCFQKR